MHWFTNYKFGEELRVEEGLRRKDGRRGGKEGRGGEGLCDQVNAVSQKIELKILFLRYIRTLQILKLKFPAIKYYTEYSIYMYIMYILYCLDLAQPAELPW